MQPGSDFPSQQAGNGHDHYHFKGFSQGSQGYFRPLATELKNLCTLQAYGKGAVMVYKL
jgi:hypothetical protein